ncbi:hypothetical protein DKX38_028713 [Salix brachista]|uniref:Uncharacterized protein n=1 Tax=Salix brachista TaxID=2182728 RepID=A0A5N5JHV9_9ROSI|nr:hypothetical protein DKX38_028713 [Salix brachista]
MLDSNGVALTDHSTIPYHTANPYPSQILLSLIVEKTLDNNGLTLQVDIIYLFSRGLSDHCKMLLGVQSKCWGWKPFRLLDWSVDEPQFVDKLKEFWNECCSIHPDRFRVLKKIVNVNWPLNFECGIRQTLASRIDAKQLQLQLDIQRLERAGENRDDRFGKSKF